MKKDIIFQLCELEKAMGRTRALAEEFTTRVENERIRLDAIAGKLTGLQGLLNKAGGVVSEIHVDLEERR